MANVQSYVLKQCFYVMEKRICTLYCKTQLLSSNFIYKNKIYNTNVNIKIIKVTFSSTYQIYLMS